MGNPGNRNAESGLNLLILSVSLALFMSGLDGTIVNIALPTISEAFQVSTSAVSWVATAYLLVMAGCVLVFGKVADMVGFRKIFLSGFVIFTLGSFSCGLLPEIAGGLYSLIGSRVLQAVGGAMISAIAPAMITAYIPMEQKGKAMGIVMTFAALGTALGPTIGGVLTQYLSWHWIFFINVPVGIFAVLLGSKVIPEAVGREKLTGFDRAGAGLVFAGLASLLFVVSEGATLGWTSPAIAALAIVAVVTLAWFVWHELRVADPLLDLGLFRNRNFLLTNLLLSLVFFSFAGINYLLPFYLKYVRSYDTSSAGLIMTSLSFAMMGAGILAGMLYNRAGPRVLCIAAGAFLTAGYFLMTRLHTGTPAGYVVVSLVLIGFGLGLMITPASNLIMNSVARTKQGMISSLTSLERFAPLTLGIAAFNLIFIQGILAIAAGHNVLMTSPAEIKMQVLAAGFDLAFLLSFVLGIVILVLALVVREEVHPDYRTGSDEDGPAIGMI
ncbi:MAG: MFS transporter [Methanoregula sp.]|jgi:EmrB/QacA subfamily drug resistance transporter|uniref:MFS transporter n=1 Tax=Methanoregula sp. TaxID=2052170 RepID=UPI003D0C3F44